MRTKMIINRMSDWFQIEDTELDLCSLSISILDKLSSRPVQGLKYDRIKLADIILQRKSAEIVRSIDNALCVLISRNLIRFETQKFGKKKIFITELGKKALRDYKEMIRDEN